MLLIEGTVSLFCSEMAIRAVHKFMDFVLQLPLECGTELTFVEDTIVNPARLDAYIIAVVTCCSEDGIDTASGFWVRMFVGVCCAEDLSVCSRALLVYEICFGCTQYDP